MRGLTRMPRRLAGAALLAGSLCLSGVPSPAHATTVPEPPVVACNPMLQRCDVAVTTPGRSARPARRTKRSRPSVPCYVRDVEIVPVDCVTAAGTWSNALECYLRPYTPQPPPGDALWQGRTTGAVYLCTTAYSPSTRPVWLATPPAGVTPEQLARQALASLTIPDPDVERSPSQAALDGGSPYTWVNLWTWWWATPATWRPLTATARAAGQWATVTVTPTAMRIDPGDGSPDVVCAGPGRAWTEADGDAAPARDGRGGCGHRYTRITRSGPLTATVTVDWAVTWQGSGATSGTLPDLQTSTATSFLVQQIQVVTR